ncbi:hypothetical protein H6G81_04245 [Scytonema hofmannii FACHB-248]|uniref:Uncharacterized protein n=1 Tax=Scytonema hofmannii FACHB-248 TaxID=1842502 RepID=A0ABR8GL45_9CYAN|nr:MULTISPECIES: hypothetical protein [Nostocales]MBD2603759.1 hypothetical protein [Scytonema hofmannii FACHB-248]
MKHADKTTTLLVSLQILLSLGLTTQVKSELETRSTFLAEKIIFTENFDPPGKGKPKDTFGAGSRGRLKCHQKDS